MRQKYSGFVLLDLSKLTQCIFPNLIHLSAYLIILFLFATEQIPFA